ncbi:type III-B CRISPR module RAMP protein Cmr1 [Tuwongella immobilis]|uniref:CRISPR type III-associated protein domain-containing protein n=1 Tax=Tuwongella immobilis TaxID=692036 RepID=A0A6C2YLD3_9BACT|nr:type III-B CRISPR module RAMP protein Cmr1 [Tuwongella immobilis]VIP02236.1 CRISPR-associated RAMP protein, Cmr1 family OS=Kyrpidia tusciae (strain DSM 2912 / NBRC 15312 / T2) GN=Btus_1363 PE=4 SV=1: RAMPs [Tuwongella immobilis]VTS00795.1 CRISPR-associated RAMP protein, Cmr1 family OS=Kyrpidia tusciae (strain DSM 2912 / NBRC 15312 / T2) GN=Btus_1363 PE=4 SV=1: RAMPs [Tuwongella immobilis]
MTEQRKESILDEAPTRPQLKSSSARVFDLSLLTVLFGGGNQTRTIDKRMPVRSTSIRGQLQFWWRATAGSRYTDLAQLREAQTAIWGNTTQSSRVSVSVEAVSLGSMMPCAVFETNPQTGRFRGSPFWNDPFRNNALPYALFPFQGQLASGGSAIEVEPAKFVRELKFRLKLQCPVELWPEVETAVWAWVHFGGVGSRTRRGCGALTCPQLTSPDEAAFRQKLPTLATPGVAQEWPIFGETYLGESGSDGISAWDRSVGELRHFRQGVNVGRNPGTKPNRPGRSRFPEPEAIRRVTRARPNKHPRLTQIPDTAYPRAEMGLPIVVHFQSPDEGGGQEPPDTTITPARSNPKQPIERMASPLILRPVKIGDKIYAMVHRLRTQPLMAVELRKGNVQVLETSDHIRGPELANYPNSPLAKSPNGSALEAFLRRIQDNGFRKV